MNNYYPLLTKTPDAENILSGIKKSVNILESYPQNSSMQDVSVSDIGKITSNLFNVCLSLLSICEEKERESGLFYDEDYNRICTGNCPVDISFSDEKLIVKTPLTIKRFNGKSEKVSKENYILQSFIKAKLTEYEEENPNIKAQIRSTFQGQPLCFYVIRLSTSFSQNIHCDNDNLEYARVQNLLCAFSGVSDRADNLDLHFAFRTTNNTSEIGTIFILTKNNLFNSY